MVTFSMIRKTKARSKSVLVKIAEQPKDQCLVWLCFTLEACESFGSPCKALPAPVLNVRRGKWKSIAIKYM